jgi:uncharacterized protein (TIGR02246 family)
MPARTPEDAHRLFADAFNAGDVEALLALYEPNAALCNGAGQPMAGLEAIRQAFEAFLSTKPRIKLETKYAIRVGDLALLRSQWEMTGMDPGGQPLQPSRHSSTEVVRRQPDGTWRYVIDHPFGAD